MSPDRQSSAQVLDDPLGLIVQARDAVSGVGVLDVGEAVPDQLADIQLVVKDAGAAPPVAVDGRRPPALAGGAGDSGPRVLDRVQDRIADCWRMMDGQIAPGRYILGDELSVLDLYVTVISRFGPFRPRFYKSAPKMAEVVRRVDADPRLTEFWVKRFPFREGWESSSASLSTP